MTVEPVIPYALLVAFSMLLSVGGALLALVRSERPGDRAAAAAAIVPAWPLLATVLGQGIAMATSSGPTAASAVCLLPLLGGIACTAMLGLQAVVVLLVAARAQRRSWLPVVGGGLVGVAVTLMSTWSLIGTDLSVFAWLAWVPGLLAAVVSGSAWLPGDRVWGVVGSLSPLVATVCFSSFARGLVGYIALREVMHSLPQERRVEGVIQMLAAAPADAAPPVLVALGLATLWLGLGAGLSLSGGGRWVVTTGLVGALVVLAAWWGVPSPAFLTDVAGSQASTVWGG